VLRIAGREANQDDACRGEKHGESNHEPPSSAHYA
jgi:hypothetical protein